MNKFEKRNVTHMLLDTSPLSQTVSSTQTPPPSSMTYFMEGPKLTRKCLEVSSDPKVTKRTERG